MLKNPTLAAGFTITLCILAVAGDAILGANRAWVLAEAVLNFPVAIALAIVGPGHGFAQLVFPFLFSTLFYFAFFWLLLIAVRHVSARNRA